LRIVSSLACFGAALALAGAASAEDPAPAPSPSPAAAPRPAAAPPPALIPRAKAPVTAQTYLISPKDGETVARTFTVRFGLIDMGIAPAGVNAPNTGHHHLIIDEVTPRLDLPIPTDDNHRHFGAGQTEVELTLPPGEHTLQLVLGDASHVPHDPAVVSTRVHVVVQP
jgi:hypothetical protein